MLSQLLRYAKNGIMQNTNYGTIASTLISIILSDLDKLSIKGFYKVLQNMKYNLNI